MRGEGSSDCSKAKAALCVALICSLLAFDVQPAVATVLPAPNIQAQLLTATFSPNRFIVRDSLGSFGINLLCFFLNCNVLEAIGDPNGQLFLIQNTGSLDPTTFLTKVLGFFGVVDAEQDQIGGTLAAAVQQPYPDYITDPSYRTPITYYGATVWQGYVTQTPNQIIRTAQTQSDFGVTGSGVTVAVIDTGVDPDNTVLRPVLVNGYDFTRNVNGGSEKGDVSQSTAGVIDSSTPPVQLNQSTAGVIDQSTAGVIDQSQYAAFGHGTMTAGIVHLVAPEANIMPLKTFNADGTGYLSDVLRAIYYAVRNNAEVISMSFEFSGSSPELASAVNYATKKGKICVASAGNDGAAATVYPASLPNVIDVASVSNDNPPMPSSFSNYGVPPVWISAPGEAVMTTYPCLGCQSGVNTYAVGWGTSFSAPFASGTVALMAEISSQITQSQAASALSNAQPISYSQYGYGVLDIYQAVQAWKSAASCGNSLGC